MKLLKWLLFGGKKPRDLFNPPNSIPCAVSGVYGTLHTDAGDFQVLAPTRVKIDCEAIIFEMPLAEDPVPQSMTSDSFTFHFGLVNVEVSCVFSFSKGDHATVEMPVVMGDLLPMHEDQPAWIA